MTTLTMPQRAALNVAYKLEPKGASANHLAAYPGVDLDVIYELVGRALLNGPDREDLRSGRMEDPRFYITPRGEAVRSADPLNQVLTTVFTSLARKLRLDWASQAVEAGDGRRVVAGAIDSGLLTLHFAGDDRETRRCGDYEFRHGRDFYVKTTHKARDVLG